VPHNLPAMKNRVVSGPVTIKQIWQCCRRDNVGRDGAEKDFRKVGDCIQRLGLDDLHFYLRWPAAMPSLRRLRWLPENG